jgi:hypothetical protein
VLSSHHLCNSNIGQRQRTHTASAAWVLRMCSPGRREVGTRFAEGLGPAFDLQAQIHECPGVAPSALDLVPTMERP